MITENLSTLKIHKLTKEQYEREVSNGNIDPNALYLTPDEPINLSDYATIEQLNEKADSEHTHDDVYYTEVEIDTKISNLDTSLKKYTDEKIASIPSVDTYTKEEVDSALAGKSNADHNHDDLYYTESEVDTKLSGLYDEIDAQKADRTWIVTFTDSTRKTSTKSSQEIYEAVNNGITVYFSNGGTNFTYLEGAPSVVNFYNCFYNNSIMQADVYEIRGNAVSNTHFQNNIIKQSNIDEAIDSMKLVVTVSRDNTNPENYVSDKSSDEIIDAYNTGAFVLCKYGSVYIPLVSIIDNGARFVLSTGDTTYDVWITDYDASVTTTYHAHEIEDVNGLQEALDGLQEALDDKAEKGNYETVDNVQLKFDEAKAYTDTHNTSTSAHNDIRTLITNLTTRLNTLADSDDTTLDQLSEIVAYIKSNKSLIDAITTSKVSVSDIVNNLTTNVANQPLSAAQGVEIKTLIDALELVVNGKANSSHTHAISNVTNLQSSLDAKQATITGGASTITSSNLTTNRALVSNSSGKVAVSAVTSTELGYLDGVTSAIQTQLDGKAASSHTHTKSQITDFPTSLKNPNSLTIQGNGTALTNGTYDGSAAKTVNITASAIGAAPSSHSHAISDVTNLQSSLDAKQATITGAATTITGSNLTASRAIVSDSSGKVAVSAVTATELGYLDGVTSAIQTQLDGKAPSTHTHVISDVTNLQSTLDIKAGKKVDGQTTTLDGVEYVGGVNAEVFNDYEANVATGAYSHAEGCYNKATGDYSHAEGAATTVSGYAGHTEGYQTKALGAASHAEGKNTAATGQTAHAEGNSSTMLPSTITPDSSVSAVETAWNSAKFTLARGIGSHAEGNNTLALSSYDHSEGYETVAKGGYSHAQGYKTVASGARAHAEGQGSVASGNDSHAEGTYTIAAGASQHVQGKYNVEDTVGKYAYIVGNGTSNNSRSNAHTLDWSGNAWFKGDVYVGGTRQDDATSIMEQLNSKNVITHYITKGSSTVLTSISVSDGSYLTALSSVTPADGYAITFDNVEYLCIAWTNEFGEICFGDGRINGDTSHIEATPFYINCCANDADDMGNLIWDWYVLFSSGTSHTMQIDSATYHTISDNFISSTFPRKNSDGTLQVTDPPTASNARARNITCSTTDLTAGSSSLATGRIRFTYS